MIGAFTAPGHAPEPIIAKGIAAVEVADAVSAAVGRWQPDRLFAFRPRAALAGPDRQWPELVKREAAVWELGRHVLDPGQLGVPVWVGGLLPGPGALEADPACMQDLPQPLSPDGHRPGREAK